MVPPSDRFDLVGQVLRRKYRVDEVVGEGGFAVVYRGYHALFQRPVAIKALKVPSHFTDDAKRLFIDKLQDEGKQLFSLSEHPAVVRVYDFDTTESGVPFLVLEWLDGMTLRSLLDARHAAGAGPFSEREAVALLRPALDALAFAHSKGIAHRDIKPENLFATSVAGSSILKLLDFGIAKAMQEGETATVMATRTSSGFQAFSATYGAPEQFLSKQFGTTGPWTDVHAVGLILTELTTDLPPYDGTDMMSLVVGATSDQRPSPRRKGGRVSDGFESFVLRCTRRSPKERFEDAGAMLRELELAIPKALDPPSGALEVALGAWSRPKPEALAPVAAPSAYGSPPAAAHTASSTGAYGPTSLAGTEIPAVPFVPPAPLAKATTTIPAPPAPTHLSALAGAPPVRPRQKGLSPALIAGIVMAVIFAGFLALMFFLVLLSAIVD